MDLPDPLLLDCDMQSSIVELKQKNLLFPVQGINPATIKGSFTEARGAGSLHHASDILAPRNTPVIAIGDGTIAQLWLSKAGGNTIYQIDPSGKYSYYYAHLERYEQNLKVGATVRRGQTIGFVGTSGNAPPGTPHLHFSISKLVKSGVWWSGASIDPFEVFKQTKVSSQRMPPQELPAGTAPNLPVPQVHRPVRNGVPRELRGRTGTIQTTGI